ncbi:MAG: 3,4-dihydroxy-2-butanone-4-phosphate synthase [Bacteroidetes bacterium MED-G13]|nr:3,4-dihydroxy-2-butanone-4-phosphate synthase [Flavobacteriaceae bacterium]PDH47359.1 MAG: 3,4-dihydroxy-2-butanone-4-phosphate synthase [Bacteroidetes bacterium MED-G13]
MSKFLLNTIESAVNDIKEGKIVIVVDDKNRENEGDFLASAELISPEIINFMATHGRGLICAPITESIAKRLKLNLMVGTNTDPQDTAFTVSIDLKGNGVTTGISANDRAKTIKALIDETIKANQFSRPGHVFPLLAKNGGVLRRTGHTEAAIDLPRLAGLKPAGVIVEIMNEDGSMARVPDLIKVAKKFDLKIISIEDLVAYRMEHDSLIEKEEDFEMNTRFGKFRLRAYKQTTNSNIHIALTKGNWDKGDVVLTRINSKSTHNDVLGSLTLDTGASLSKMFEIVNKDEKGAIIFISAEIKSIETLKRLKILKNKQNKDSITEAPILDMDDRDFGIGAQILHDLNITNLKLITNTKGKKRVGMIGYGLEISEYVSF